MQYKYRNGLWPMQYVFFICSSAGGKKYVTRRVLLIYERFLTMFYAKFQRYFTQKRGTLFIVDVVWT